MRLAFLVDARRLDSRYAADLAGEARSGIAVLVDDRPIASTSTGPALATLAAHLRRRDLPVRSGAFEAGGERHAYLLVQRVGPAAIYAVASITAARDRATAAAVPRLLAIVAGGLVLCLVASISLARRVAAPIDRVSRDIHAMVESTEDDAGGDAGAVDPGAGRARRLVLHAAADRPRSASRDQRRLPRRHPRPGPKTPKPQNPNLITQFNM